MVSEELQRLYREARSAGSMVVGESAKSALRNARIVQRFHRLEDLGYVRLIAEPDDDWEPGCACGDPKCPNNNPESEAFGSVGEYRLNLPGINNGWYIGSSVWGSVGYKNVLDWRENYYIVDIMDETINAFAKAWRKSWIKKRDLVAGRCPHCHGTGRTD